MGHLLETGNLLPAPGIVPALGNVPTSGYVPAPDFMQSARVLAMAASDPVLLNDSANIALSNMSFTFVDAMSAMHDCVHPSVLLGDLMSDTIVRSRSVPDAVTLTVAAIEELSCRIDKPFTIQCMPSDLPTVPVCAANACSSVSEFLKTDLAGNTVYLHAPTTHMPVLMQHYHKCCEAKPDESTCAVFVVTDFLYKSQSTLFAGMRLLRTYAKGTPVNLLHFSNKPAKLGKTNTKMHVFYHGPDCTPAATMVLPTTVDPVLDIEPPPALYDPPALTSVFKGTISGAAATVGCDSFCQGLGFVHPAFVTAHQLKTVPIPNMTVQLGDGTSKHHANLACKV